MRFRKLRIAWSAAWVVVAMLLILLWVRSCWKTDVFNISLPASCTVGSTSFSGSFSVGVGLYSSSGFIWQTEDVDTVRQRVGPEYNWYYASIWGRFYFNTNRGFGVTVPHWFLIGLSLALSFVPWVRWSNRFTVRTMLIAMTLIAVVLGLIVWSAR